MSQYNLFEVDEISPEDLQAAAEMSATVKSHSGKKYAQFRKFVEDNYGEIYDNGQQFKDAFVSTGVSTVLVVLNKYDN